MIYVDMVRVAVNVQTAAEERDRKPSESKPFPPPLSKKKPSQSQLLQTPAGSTEGLAITQGHETGPGQGDKVAGWRRALVAMPFRGLYGEEV